MISVTHVVMFFSRNFLFVFYDLRMCMKEEESLGSNYFKGDNSECWSDLTLVLLVLIFIHPRVIVTYCSSTLVYTHKVIQFLRLYKSSTSIIHIHLLHCVYIVLLFSIPLWRDERSQAIVMSFMLSLFLTNTSTLVYDFLFLRHFIYLF